MNWKRPAGRFIFSEQEILEIAYDYDQYNQECGMMFKSRNKCFAPGEMERWLVNGIHSAYTVEEYVSFGNGFFILDYSDYENTKKYTFKTTTEMLQILEELKDVKSLEIKLDYNRGVLRPKASKAPRKPLDTGSLPQYYVLKGEHKGEAIYFIKFSQRGGFKYYLRPVWPVKPFRNEKDAQKYLAKYHDRLVVKYHFMPELITKPA
ncbi:MAG: hypothetical protein LBS19_09730 [Clostridiales bacterium]|nr:hypothetical protein [Clostridiales bacterium]